MSWRRTALSLLRGLVPRAAVRGHVDAAEGLQVRGWGAGFRDRRVAIDVRHAGVPVPVELERVSRPDVVRQLGVKVARRYGFVLTFGPAYWAGRKARAGQAATFDLLFDGHRFASLPAPDAARLETFLREAAEGASAHPDGAPDGDEGRTLLALSIAAALGGADALPIEARAALVEAAARRGLAASLAGADAGGELALARSTRTWLDSVPTLAWQGWACAGADAVERFAVTCNGVQLPVAPHRQPRSDVADRLGVARAALGFVCDVPGNVWRHAGPDGVCALSLQVNGRVVDGSAMRLDPETLRRAIDAIVPAPGDAPIASWPSTRLAVADAALGRLAEHARAAADAGFLPAGRRDDTVAARRAIDALVQARGLRLSEPGSLRVTLESTAELTFSGWACDVVANDEVFELTCDGQPVESIVFRVSRGDVQEALQSARTDLGFVLPVPAALWHRPTAVPARERRFRIGLAVNGLPVLDDFVLDVGTLSAALVAASRALHAGRQVDFAARFNRARWLHLIAHAEAAGGVGVLEPAAQAAVEGARARLQVSDRLDVDEVAVDPSTAASGTADARLVERVGRLQKRLNRMLGERSPAAALERLLAEPGADRRARDHLLLGLVPWACEVGAFDRLRAEIGTDVARHFAEGGNVWHRTLLLPFLVADGAFDEAAEVLADVAARPAVGWVNTECVEFAVRAALASTSPAVPDDAPCAALLRAFAALLDTWRADAWSRLTDTHLRAALVAAVAAGTLPGGPAVRETLDRAAVQAFGLQPDFWHDLAAAAGGPVAADRATLKAARADAALARDAVEALRAHCPEGAVGAPTAAVLAALPALERLRSAGVSEAPAWIRELALAASRRAPDDAALRAAAMQALTALDAADPWRLLSAPVASSTRSPDPADEARHAAALAAATAGSASPTDELVVAFLAARRATPVADADDGDALVALWKALKPLLLARHGAVGLPWAVELLDAGAGDASSAPDGASSGLAGESAAEVPRLAIENALRQAAAEGAVRASAGLAPAAPLVSLLSSPRASGPAGAALRRQLVDTLDPRVASRLAAPDAPALATAASRRAPGVLLAVDAHDADLAAARVTAADLAASGLSVVLLTDAAAPDASPAFVPARGPGTAPELALPTDATARLLALGAWTLGRTDAALLCLVDAGGTPRPEALSALVPHRDHYVGWPARRQARLPEPGRRPDRATSISVATTAGGLGLSRWALAALCVAHGDATAPSSTTSDRARYLAPVEPALLALPVADRVAELLARAGVTLAPAPRFALAPGLGDVGTPKLWPTGGPARVESLAGSNELVLLSPRERIARIDAAPVIVVAVARNEREMLPHFLAHYRRLGVEGFVVVDNGSDDGSVPLLQAQPDVLVYAAATEYRQSHYGVSWQQAVLAAHGAGKWALVADLDELLVYPGCESRRLDELVATLDAQGATAAEILMVDLYPRGGLADARIGDADPFTVAPCFDDPPLQRWHLGSGYYSAGSTWLSGLRHRLIPDAPPNAFTSQKVALLRWAPWVRLSEGLHYASGLAVATRSLAFAHFKYHARFLEKVEDEIRRMQHYDDAAEYRQYLGMREAATRGFFVEGRSGTWQGSRTWPSEDVRGPDARGVDEAGADAGAGASRHEGRPA
jgi:hypothetical protein